jgi:hypothetical protein
MLGIGAALICLVQAAPGPSPSPSATSSPSPAGSPQAEAPRRLRLDIDKHVEDVMQSRDDGTPRFRESVDVLGRPPDVVLEEQLREFDLECGPGIGPPTHVESREFRPHSAPFMDWSALAKYLAGVVSQPGPPRYFLYSIQRPGGLEYLLREGRLTLAPGQQPIPELQLVGNFPDLASAVRGFQRMERGFGDPQRTDSTDPAPPWSSAPCRFRPRR